MRFHLAQLTIARMRQPFDHPDSATLLTRVDEMNQLAEQSPGFIWRLPGNAVTPADLAPFATLFTPFDPQLVFYTLSLWNTVEDLKHYVYRTRHAETLRAKENWIEKSPLPNLAMWWVPAGARPTIAESAQRWQTLCKSGPIPEAFTFARHFPNPTA